MVAAIVLVDQLFWRPLVAWSQRFKMEETAEADQPESWVLDLLRRSRIYQRFQDEADRGIPEAVSGPTTVSGFHPHVQKLLIAGWKVIRPALFGYSGSLAVAVGWGCGPWCGC
jgi:hypothetical protein